MYMYMSPILLQPMLAWASSPPVSNRKPGPCHQSFRPPPGQWLGSNFIEGGFSLLVVQLSLEKITSAG